VTNVSATRRVVSSQPKRARGGPRLIALAATLLAAALIVVGPASATGTVASQQAKVFASDAESGDEFGSAVAIDGDTMVVGAPDEDDGGRSAGSVYVYVRSGDKWTQQGAFIASDSAPDGRFGASVAISGDSIVVGAPDSLGIANTPGAAYVFVRNGTTWSEQAKLTGTGVGAAQFFGQSVGISGDTVVVGKAGFSAAGMTFSPGSAYVFERSGTKWAQQAELMSSEGAAGDVFGWSVAISGSSIAVGAIGDTSGTQPARAYVFVRSGTKWVQQARLTASDGFRSDGFGTGIAIFGGSVVVGAFGDDDAGFLSGSAYVFVRSGTKWAQQAKLTAKSAAPDDRFAGTVAISGDTVVVGAHSDDDSATNSGSAYVFVRDGKKWAEQAELRAETVVAADNFGTAVAVSGGSVVIGSTGDDGAPGGNAGAAYVFVLDHPPPPALVRRGYWMLEADGTIYGYGDSESFAPIQLSDGATAVAFDRTADGEGLWLLDSNGKVYVRGTATHQGDAGLQGDRVASISATPSGNGYWVFTELGRVLIFGDAASFGDLITLGITPNGPVVASAPTPSGNGYYMLGSDGGVFAFGDAKFSGSLPAVLPASSLVCPIVGLVPTPSGSGYWMVACDGGVFAFGDANFVGSVPGVLAPGAHLNSPVNGLVPYGNGYLMVASDGGVFTFSDLDFLGSLGATPPNTPIVAITAFVS
jgi:FG-GAP repeat